MGRCSGGRRVGRRVSECVGAPYHLPCRAPNQPDRSRPKEKVGKVKTALQMLDILLVPAPYLPVVQKAEVVGVVVRGGVLDLSDGVVQKVGMRLVGRLVDLGGEGVLTSVGGVGELLERFAAVEGSGATGGGKVRGPSPLYAGACINWVRRTDCH